ncbi:methylated-DNA--[protein]-cysteine S-methyltransferase [Bradyrhizobium sp.]|uniref:methylated-DNA--[protein]-cysteine S-methyltransferase n=1 Tax=Bradyrhizobium sp. TaxID=376 RepID=UPI003C4F1401
MIGRGYAIFDTAVGRCGIVWGHAGILSVQLPQAREIDTRRRLFHFHPEARELAPTHNVTIATHGIAALLRGGPADFTDVTLDMEGIPPFNRRAYEFVRTIPRGETRSYDEVATQLRIPGAAHAIAEVVAKNPFLIIVPCHRVLPTSGHTDQIAPNGGTISKRHLLSIEGAQRGTAKSLFDVLLPVAPHRPHP